MRDGVKLFTSIYVPRDSSRAHPIIMSRTPYGVGPYGADSMRTSFGPSGNPKFQDAGFIFVYQDVRGRFYSEGAFAEMRPHHDKTGAGERAGATGGSGRAVDTDESTDSYDTIDWLIKNVPG